MRDRTIRAYRVVPPSLSVRPPELACVDYVSAFAVANTHPQWTSEQWARAVWEGAPVLVQVALRSGWRICLRLQLATRHQSGYVLGWQLTENAPANVRLESPSPLIGTLNRVLVDADEVRWVTYIHFKSVAARLIWAVMAPVHHAVVPRTLAHAARTE